MTRPKLLFVSYHCSEDPTNGAALATRDQFGLLSARGWPCRVLTGPLLDDPKAPPVGEALRSRPGVHATSAAAGRGRFTLYSVPGSGYPTTVFESDPPAAYRRPTADEVAAFRSVCKASLAEYRPDVVLTYGGDPATLEAVAAAKEAGAKVVFRLHNFSYTTASAFEGCDAVVVPSAYSRDHYKQTLGLDCVHLPYLLDWRRLAVPDPAPKYVTVVNPDPAKGVFAFARIAQVLGRERPDVPLLVVEGRGRADWLGRCEVDLTAVRSVHKMGNTPDPRQFYRVSKIVLVPSAWRESFGRVAAEAMLNGVPVIASDRGALPETVGGGGACLPLPKWLQPETRIPPGAADVRKWVDAVLKLWDDPTAYAAAAAAARERARAWHPDVALPRWEAFLGGLANRSGSGRG